MSLVEIFVAMVQHDVCIYNPDNDHWDKKSHFHLFMTRSAYYTPMLA